MSSVGFCFCKGELVECTPGRLQDCNVKRLQTCPLEENVKDRETKKEKSKIEEEYGGFCFCKGEMVKCIPGRVQDCNVKKLNKCPLEEEENKVEEKRLFEEYGGFCFCKGELVKCIAGRVQDCNVKKLSKCPLED